MDQQRDDPPVEGATHGTAHRSTAARATMPQDAAANAAARPGGWHGDWPGDPPGGWPVLSAEDRFARVVEAAPTALVLMARTGRIEMVNRQGQRMFGYDHAELVGEPLEMLMPERFRDGQWRCARASSPTCNPARWARG